MSEINQFVPYGVMDYDQQQETIRDGNYPSALDIEHETNDTRSTQGTIPKIGNTLAYQIGSVSVQNKTYRIYVQAGATVRTLQFYNANGVNFTSAVYTEAGTVGGTQTNAQTAITAAIGACTYTNGADYMDFEPTSVTGIDFRCTSDTFTNPTVLQEGYPSGFASDMHIIASYDLLGDLIQLSTNQTSLPVQIGAAGVVTNVVNNGSGRFRVTTSVDHGLLTGDLIAISNVNGTTLVNGQWIVAVINNTTFDCEEMYANFAGVFAASPNSTIYKNIVSVSEIGVAQKDFNTGTWSYTRLLRTREWNFRTKKQIDIRVEQTATKISAYWVDDYNVSRVFYYRGAYVADGAVSVLNPGFGLYDYGGIDAETRFFLNTSGMMLRVVSMSDTGGAVRSGSWRYTARGLDDSLVGSDYLDLLNPIQIFQSRTNFTGTTSGVVSGDDDDIQTTKIVNLSITGITPGIFKYIELVGLHYLGDDTVIGYVLNRVPIGDLATTININHTGLETDVTEFDVASILVTTPGYTKAKSIELLDKRPILSNLETEQILDLAAWTETFQHAVKRRDIATVGNYNTGLNLGGYCQPLTAHRFAGYMLNEVYRFGIKVRWKKSKSYSPVYWIDDIKIDTSATNITTPNRRTAGLATNDLTDLSASVQYAFFVEFSNIDFTYVVDGVAIKDLIDEIVFERAERVQEVLASGVIAMGISGNLVEGAFTFGYNPTPATTCGEYPYISRNLLSANVVYPGVATAQRQFAFFYSPDVIYQQTSLEFFSGDQLLVMGQPTNPSGAYNLNSGARFFDSNFQEYDGYVNISTKQTMTVQDVYPELQAGTSAAFGGSTVSKSLSITSTPLYNYPSPVIKVTANINPGSANPDYGLYMAQYVRPIPYNSPDDNKYGSRASTVYIPTGLKYTVTSTSTTIGTGVIAVYGGDVFTEKFWLRHRWPSDATEGWGGAIAFYSQSVVNPLLNRKYNSISAMWRYPYDDSAAITVTTWTDDNIPIDPVYAYGYNIRNGVSADAGFDTLLEYPYDYPCRIIWGGLKPQGSVNDPYRTFLPLDFHDLDMKDGEIMSHLAVNGELFTWQPRKVMRQYFNATGELQTTNTQIVIGDGSVLARDGQAVTSFGCSHKWSIIKGRSAQGNDTVYWIDAELKEAMRLGGDGSISLINGMRSWFANNLTWVQNIDTPADGYGICGVWDQRKKEMYWTVRGHRYTGAAWSQGVSYFEGDIVYKDPGNGTFNQTRDYYICLQDNLSTPDNEPGSVGVWQLDWTRVSHSDSNYYNEWSLIYNETRNGFTAFFTPLPKIYLQWKNTFLTPRPILVNRYVYEHNIGTEAIWYLFDGSRLQSDPYIEGTMNQPFFETKWFEAIKVVSDSTPYRVDFTTKTQVSFLDEAEFDTREDASYSSIKEDSTSNSLNNGNTSLLYGQWLKVRITFEKEVYNKIVGWITKARISPRVSKK